MLLPFQCLYGKLLRKVVHSEFVVTCTMRTWFGLLEARRSLCAYHTVAVAVVFLNTFNYSPYKESRSVFSICSHFYPILSPLLVGHSMYPLASPDDSASKYLPDTCVIFNTQRDTGGDIVIAATKLDEVFG